MPARTTISHPPSRIRMVRIPDALNLVVRIIRYRFTDGRVNIRPMPEKRRRLTCRNLIARPWKIDRDRLVDAARRAAQHHDAVAEVYRLFYVMSNEDKTRAGVSVHL